MCVVFRQGCPGLGLNQISTRGGLGEHRGNETGEPEERPRRFSSVFLQPLKSHGAWPTRAVSGSMRAAE